jgi:hypothetical protein
MQDALARVDNWTMQADSVSLIRARMAPLLRLVARQGAVTERRAFSYPEISRSHS